MKKCIDCGIEKPLTEFAKASASSKDGTLNQCKNCKKDYAKSYLEKKKKTQGYIQQERDRCREKYYRLKPKKCNYESKKAAFLTYCLNFPEKRLANYSLFKIKHLKEDGFNLHHWSYNNEHFLDVIKVKKSDHYALHRKMIYDQEYYMYRRIDTMELLDTKAMHIEYIQSLGIILTDIK